MTPELLKTTGLLLYGPNWARPLSVALRVAPRNVLRWAAGSHNIPPGVAAELAEICHARAEKLAEAVGVLLALTKEPTR